MIFPMSELKFRFKYHVNSPKELEYNSKHVQDLLEKWGMKRHKNVRKEFKVQSDQNNWNDLNEKIHDIVYEKVPCNVTTLNFFDRLYDAGIVRRESGAIVKTSPIYLEENISTPIMITDELRKLLLIFDSPHYNIFSIEDRNEFIFRIFKSICLGGDVCQFEDLIIEYLNVLKKIYKDLISVQKNEETGDLIIKSFVYKIINLSNNSLFPPSTTTITNDNINCNNFCYMTIDPVNRWVNIWYHAAYEYLC